MFQFLSEIRILLLTKAFKCYGDFLIGEGENASYDKETVERINDIQKMDANTKGILFNVIDTYIQNFKTKQAFANQQTQPNWAGLL